VRSAQRTVLLLLAPWFLCSLLGQIWSQSLESRYGIALWKEHTREYLPRHGSDLYVLPSEIIPYFQEGLSEFRTHPIEDLVQVPDDEKDVYVMNANFWDFLNTTRDNIVLTMIKRGALSSSVDTEVEPKFMGEFRIFRLRDFQHASARDLLIKRIGQEREEIPDSISARALPEFQRPNEGWSVNEVDSQFNIIRWGCGGKSRIRFEGSVLPGDYLLHVIGYRSAHPEDPAPMTFSFLHEKDTYEHSQVSGSFHIQIPVRLTRRHVRVILRVTHPVWQPRDYDDDSQDGRPLTFMFQSAWLEKREKK